MRRAGWVLVGFSLCLAGCFEGRKSAEGFRLPDGDVERGRQAFLDLRCNNCHDVAGVELPAPVAQPPVGVELGGPVAAVRTDGYLVTSVVHPSHDLASSIGGQGVAGHLSRMGSFTEAMTVSELIDIVAFLHSRYEVIPQPVAGP